jgi:hypothetical protein
MTIRPKRAAAWLPVLFVPLVALAGQGLGCELLVNVNPMLVDGSPDDVIVPTTLDGYHCGICTDVSPEADFDGDEAFPAPEPKDATGEASAREAAAESSARDAGADAGRHEEGGTG